MKRCLFFTWMLCVMTSTWGTGMYRFPINVKQGDGTMLTIVGHGDEDFHWTTTTDGVIVLKNGDSFYVASIDQNGKLTPSKFLAHNLSERTLQEKDVIALQDRERFLKIAEETMIYHRSVRQASIAKNSKSPYTPHMGDIRGIIILVETADTAFTLPNPKKSFENYFNGDHADDPELVNGEQSNIGSVQKYFNDISFGNLSLSFDIYGPVKLKGKTSEYSTNRIKLVGDACKAADDLIDFSNPAYDADGDGVVDFVSVIYAGYSASYAGSPKEWIWPASNGTQIGTFDGMKVFRWLVSNELNGFPGAFSTEPYCRINGIGLFCHEFSHCMGLPDIYPRDASAQINNQAMEFWDLMDGGEYLQNGYAPPPYTAWERETMGWMEVATLIADQHGIVLRSVDSDGKAFRFMNPNDNTNREYMMIENIQNKGWNFYQKGHGLLVYHVNYASDVVNVTDYPNNVKGSPRMAIVPADGLLFTSYYVEESSQINPETGKTYTSRDYFDQLAGDPFPGTKSVSSLKYDMRLPNFKWYNGDMEVKQALLNITEDTAAGTITFDYITDITNGISRAAISENDGKDGNNRIFTIDGRAVNVNTPLPKGIYIQSGRKFIVR